VERCHAGTLRAQDCSAKSG